MEEKLKKITKYLYDNGLNYSSNSRKRPCDDDKISVPIELDVINVGLSFKDKSKFIRYSFFGSKSWYSIAVENTSQMDAWYKIIKELVEDRSNFIDDIFG